MISSMGCLRGLRNMSELIGKACVLPLCSAHIYQPLHDDMECYFHNTNRCGIFWRDSGGSMTQIASHIPRP